MQDMAGNIVEVGDPVVAILPYYSSLKKGKCVKINPKSITVEYKDGDSTKRTSRFTDQFMKIVK